MNIHNFRSFQHQKLNFSKVNILIGENSGGKSSLLKLLLALKQTLDSPNEVNLKLKGDFTDLGNYEGVVYNRKKTSKISIGFENNTDYFDYFLEFLNDSVLQEEQADNELDIAKKIIEECTNSTTGILFEFTSKLDDHSSIKTKIKNDKIGTLIIIQNKNANNESIRELIVDLEFNFGTNKGTIKNCAAVKDGFFTIVFKDFRDECEKQFGQNYKHIFYSIAYLLVFQNYVTDEIKKIAFVNPIGNSPKRLYYQEDKKMNYKLIDIEKFINIIGNAKEGRKKIFQNSLNDILKDFGIAEEIQIIKDKLLPVLALNVKTKGFWSNITDVGYGVSLQIPILFQALLSEQFTKKGQTILIEQPEIHLHPALQAKFIETLLGIGNKNTYFIETHSEHIIRKLQVLVKEGRFGLKPEDISVHYFKRESSKFEITEHKILENGRLSPSFPSGFFDVSYSLVKELL